MSCVVRGSCSVQTDTAVPCVLVFIAFLTVNRRYRISLVSIVTSYYYRLIIIISSSMNNRSINCSTSVVSSSIITIMPPRWYSYRYILRIVLVLRPGLLYLAPGRKFPPVFSARTLRPPHCHIRQVYIYICFRFQSFQAFFCSSLVATGWIAATS